MTMQLAVYFGESKGGIKWEVLFQRFEQFTLSYQQAVRSF